MAGNNTKSIFLLASTAEIHALREEGDVFKRSGALTKGQFLSTPSARRATGQPAGHVPAGRISIHALREEGDSHICALCAGFPAFLSTPSARRATRLGSRQRRHRAISIHALREEGDPRVLSTICSTVNFYPRPPRGGRPPPSVPGSDIQSDFYPRPPRGGRPNGQNIECAACRFLSTPSARRATISSPISAAYSSHFYPRPPRGGRPSAT